MVVQISQFFVRPFPSPDNVWKNIKFDSIKKMIYIRSTEDWRKRVLGNDTFWQFKTDGVAPNLSQEEFYRMVLSRELMEKIIKGIDLVILFFGGSGSGKTYSALGLHSQHEYRGIAPRLLENLFKLKEDNSELFKMDIYISFTEIIGKKLHNLLIKGKPSVLTSGNKSYNTLLAVNIKSTCHGIKLMFEGDDRRNFENENSHCGTSILTFEIACSSLIKDNAVNTTARIHVVDMAGTDFGCNAVKSLKCHVDANLTKCSLNTVCSWLKENPYEKRIFNQRVSILCVYLGTSFTNGLTRFIGHIKTSDDDLRFSISTLLFGTTLRKLPSPLLLRAKKLNKDLIIRNLEEDIAKLKDDATAEKLIHGTLIIDTMSQEQLNFIMKEIKYFLNSDITDKCLLAKAHPSTLLTCLKDLYERDIYSQRETYEKLIQERDATILTFEVDKSKRLRQTFSKTSYVKKNVKSTATIVSQTTHTTTEGLAFGFENGQTFLYDEMIGEDNYAKTFSEFLAKVPQIRSKIKFLENEIDVNLKMKYDIQSKLTDSRYEISLLKMELEHEEWNTFHISLEENSLSHEYRINYKSQKQMELEADIENKVKEFNSLRSTLVYAHNDYVKSKNELSELMVEAEKQYNEYVQLLYNNLLLLPPKEKIEEKQESAILISEEKVGKETESPSKCFYKLQRKQERGIFPKKRKCTNSHDMKLYFGNRPFWKCNLRQYVELVGLGKDNWFEASIIVFSFEVHILLVQGVDIDSILQVPASKASALTESLNYGCESHGPEDETISFEILANKDID